MWKYYIFFKDYLYLFILGCFIYVVVFMLKVLLLSEYLDDKIDYVIMIMSY